MFQGPLLTFPGQIAGKKDSVLSFPDMVFSPSLLKYNSVKKKRGLANRPTFFFLAREPETHHEHPLRLALVLAVPLVRVPLDRQRPVRLQDLLLLVALRDLMLLLQGVPQPLLLVVTPLLFEVVVLSPP